MGCSNDQQDVLVHMQIHVKWSDRLLQNIPAGPLSFSLKILSLHVTCSVLWYFDWVKKVKWKWKWKSNTGKELTRKITCWLRLLVVLLQWWVYLTRERHECLENVQRKYVGVFKMFPIKGAHLWLWAANKINWINCFGKKASTSSIYYDSSFEQFKTSIWCTYEDSLICDDSKSSWRLTFKQSTRCHSYRRIDVRWENSYQCIESGLTLLISYGFES